MQVAIFLLHCWVQVIIKMSNKACLSILYGRTLLMVWGILLWTGFHSIISVLVWGKIQDPFQSLEWLLRHFEKADSEYNKTSPTQPFSNALASPNRYEVLWKYAINIRPSIKSPYKWCHRLGIRLKLRACFPLCTTVCFLRHILPLKNFLGSRSVCRGC